MADEATLEAVEHYIKTQNPSRKAQSSLNIPTGSEMSMLATASVPADRDRGG